MLHDNLGLDHIHVHVQSHPPLTIHFTKSWPWNQTRPYYRLWPYYRIPCGFHRTFATGASSQHWWRLIFRTVTWSCPIRDLYFFSYVDLSLLNLSFSELWISSIPRFLYIASLCLKCKLTTDRKSWSCSLGFTNDNFICYYKQINITLDIYKWHKSGIHLVLKYILLFEYIWRNLYVYGALMPCDTNTEIIWRMNTIVISVMEKKIVSRYFT